MSNFAELIADALDILKYDGAVQDTLAELRKKWGAQVPALLEERFDVVGVQYMKLPHEKGTAAINALLDEMQRAKERVNRVKEDAQK